MTVRDLIILGCSSQQPTRTRNHGAYLVRWKGEGFLFDPGEGTQRQFIFANIAPTCVNRIFISHFHGDHCLGAGSMLMRLNLDKVKHPIHCYYPAQDAEYFYRIRHGTRYREYIQIVEHPIERGGVIEEGAHFRIEAFPLDHGVTNFAFRITERDRIKFDKGKLIEKGVFGQQIQTIQKQGSVQIGGKIVKLEEVSFIKKGQVFALIMDTIPCTGALAAARDATVLLCESTYLDKEVHLAGKYLHMTAKQAAELAKKSGAKELILTHFSARYRNTEEFEREARVIFPNTFAAEDLRVFPFPREE